MPGARVRRWALATVLGAGVAAVAYWRRALTADGAAGAAAIGCITFGRGGAPAAAALLTFFVSSSALSRLGASRKAVQAKGAKRDVWQVLANGGFATLSILLGQRRGGGGFLGALSAAGADTWATELGMLAGRNPRLITTMRPVAPGTSGGVTLAGVAASIGGGLSVGLAWACVGGGRRAVPVALVAGLCGSLIDSLLGATLQAVYRCPVCDELIEEAVHRRCGQPAQLVRGRAWATNDTINALSTLAGASIGSTCWK